MRRLVLPPARLSDGRANMMSRREALVLFGIGLVCIAVVGFFLYKALTVGGFQ